MSKFNQVSPMAEDNKKIDRRVWNGGAREGAGRPPRTLPKAMDDFLNEIVVVKEQRISYRNGKPYRQVRSIRKTRYAAMLDSQFKYAPFTKGNKRATNYLLKLGDTPEWEPPREKKKPKTDPQVLALRRAVRAWKKQERAREKGREVVEMAEKVAEKQRLTIEERLRLVREKDEPQGQDYVQWNGRKIISGQKGRISRR